METIGHVLAAVPSIGPPRKAWAKLGFEPTDPFEYQGCSAFDIPLGETSLRFVGPVAGKPASALAEAVRDRLIGGSGLLGWTWTSSSPEDSCRQILASLPKDMKLPKSAKGEMAFPPKSTPGAATFLEQRGADTAAKHPNQIEELDHVVLMTPNANETAATFVRHYGLSPRPQAMNDRQYVYLKVSKCLVEIVGPQKAEPGRGGGHLWGLAFRSSDLDATVSHLHDSGVQIKAPHDAVQGGRITGLPMALGGIQIAFIGK